MRKKARRSSSPKSITTATERRALPIVKETIRTLISTDLTQVITGINVVCPTGSPTQTQEPNDG